MSARNDEFLSHVEPGPRIAIVGVTGSGKTTVAEQLANVLQIPHIELDAIHWGPNWSTPDPDVFFRRVDQALSGPAWVTDGNYGKVRSIVWERATTLIWLDFPLPVILWQLTLRTLRRIQRKEVLWETNRETLRDAFLSKDSLFLYAITSQPRHRSTYPQLLSLPEYAHLQVLHFYSRREVDNWLAAIKRNA